MDVENFDAWPGRNDTLCMVLDRNDAMIKKRGALYLLRRNEWNAIGAFQNVYVDSIQNLSERTFRCSSGLSISDHCSTRLNQNKELCVPRLVIHPAAQIPCASQIPFFVTSTRYQ
jgi:hypothetical protein